MKRLFSISLLLISLTFAAAAQRQKTEPVGDPVPGNGSTSRTTAPDKSKPLLLTNTGLEATLMSTLDVRRSKVGDEVVLKTTKSIKQNGEVVIPKGSKLIGRVTEVQRKGEGNAGSKLGLLFERIEGKGLAAPITASIVSITDARAAASLADSAMADVSGSSATRASASRGGLLGGVGSTVGGVVNGATQTVGSVAGTAVSTTGSTVGAVGGTLRGIQITQSASGSANGSAMLTANDKNVKVDKGVTFNLLVSGSTGN